VSRPSTLWVHCGGGLNIRVRDAALEKLNGLPLDLQHRLRQMLCEIAEMSAGTPRSWQGKTMLRLDAGKAVLFYSLESSNTDLVVEHVLVSVGERTG
jgi:hypothetical protein